MLDLQRLTASSSSYWLTSHFVAFLQQSLCNLGGCAVEVTGLDKFTATLPLVYEAYDWLDAHVRISSFPSHCPDPRPNRPCRRMQRGKSKGKMLFS